MKQEKAIVMCVEFFDSHCESNFYHFYMPERISSEGYYISPDYFEKSFDIVSKLQGDMSRRLIETYMVGGYKDLLITSYIQNKIKFLLSMITYKNVPASCFWDCYKIISFYLHEQELLLQKMRVDMTNWEKQVQENVKENLLYFLRGPFREYDQMYWEIIESNLRNHGDLKTICEVLKQDKPWQYIEKKMEAVQ